MASTDSRTPEELHFSGFFRLSPYLKNTSHKNDLCIKSFWEEQKEKQKGCLLKGNYDSHYFPYKKPTVSSVTIFTLSDVLIELNTLPFLIN